MKHLLGRQHIDVVAQLAWANVLLAFDFDGTLAPIVADRDKAKMRSRTARLFGSVCERYPCVVISGRSRADVAPRLGGAAVRRVVGNHGLEPGDALPQWAAGVARSRDRLVAALAGVEGVDVEDKRYSLAVHYRRSRRKLAALAAILDAVTGLPERMRVIRGKRVINLLPEGAPHKGDALTRLRDALRADTALYVGDDAADEDVFTLDQPGRLVTVRVRASRSSAAAYHLRDQREIDALLALLLSLRGSGHAR